MSEKSPAVERDPPRAEILRLLSAAKLPITDIGAIVQQSFFGIRESVDGTTWIGVVGVERHGDEMLLRSLTVSPAARGRGLGASLVGAVESMARARAVRRVVLLTNDLQAYFSGLGYRPVERASLSKALARSTQLASICSASATVMAKELS